MVWPDQRLRDNLGMLLDLHAGASQERKEPEADVEPADFCEFLQCEALPPDVEDDVQPLAQWRASSLQRLSL